MRGTSRSIRANNCGALKAVCLAFVLSGLWIFGRADAQMLADFAVSHVKSGWPWKIPLSVGKGKGIVFLLGIDNRLTAYDLKSGNGLWTFQMGLGRNEYLFNYLPLADVKGQRLTFVLNEMGYLHALDVESGIPLWRTYDQEKFIFPPVCVGGWVLAVSEQGWLYKFDALTGAGLRANDPASRIVYREKKIIARPTVVRDADEKRPAYVVCLVEDRPGERELIFLDFTTHKIEDNFSTKIEERDLRDSPVSAPLFSTGHFSARGISTMRIFVPVRSGNNEMIYVKDYTVPRSPFTLFYKLRNGRLCEEPTFTEGGYVVLPNTSGKLYVLRPDGKELKEIVCSETPGAMSVLILEQPAAAYGVLLVQSADNVALYKLSLENRLGGFDPLFPFQVWAWPVVSTRAAAIWRDPGSKFVGEPRLPLVAFEDKVVLTSQVEDTAFLACYRKDVFLERERTEPPEVEYFRSTKPGGSDFLTFDLIDNGRRILLGYGELGTYLIDTAKRQVLAKAPLKTRLAMGTPHGHIIFSESEQDGIYMSLMDPALSRTIFKQSHLADEVVARPVLVGNKICFATRSVLYARDLKPEAEPLSVPALVSSPLLLHKDTLILGTRSGYLDGTNVADLKKIWTFKVQGRVVASPIVHGEELYFGTSEGVVYGMPVENREGRFNRTDAFMRLELAKKGAIYAPPVRYGDSLYVASSPARGQTILSRIDITVRDMPREVWQGLFFGEVRQPMLLYNDILLLAASERIVAVKLGTEPHKLWEEKLLDSVASPLHLLGTELYFLCRDGSIYCLDLEKRIF